MSRYLLLDIGAGTLDLLCYDSVRDQHFKAVVRSPVRVVADEIRNTHGKLVVTGGEMGGGPVSQALIDRARSVDVAMSASSAATVHHDVKRVTDLGIRVIDTAAAEELTADPDFSHIRTGDIQIERLRRLVEGLGVVFEFDAVAVCAQDHGAAPSGVSHLDYRHRIFTAALESDPAPQALLYPADQVPRTMNRLATLVQDAQMLPAKRVYVMDSGMAAILGASMDGLAMGKERILVLDVATSHTVGAAMENGRLGGFFEYHTQDVTAPLLDRLLVDLADGRLTHRQILASGGHGAYIRSAFGYDSVQAIIATGPRRRLVSDCRLPIVFGAPWGDNMMTGTVGLMEAVRQREAVPPILYL